MEAKYFKKVSLLYPSVFMVTVLVGLLATLPVSADISKEPQVQQFIDEMVKEHKYDRKTLNTLFAKVKKHSSIISAITRPAEKKPWYKYRPIFLGKKRITLGVQFWNENQALLQRAHEEFGVNPETIVAIIGVETRYGKHKGSYPVVDALSTLGFFYPPRSPFFKKELREFLLLAREEKIDPYELTGSYAGAMGLPQFMPSSFREYAIDYDHDGKRDIWTNNADTIGSVANYLKRHGWQKGQNITFPAKVSGKGYKSVIEQGLKPKLNISQLEKKGVKVDNHINKNTSAALIELENRFNNEYWVGLDNFYAITRYNHSALYGMAVFQLGQEIMKMRNN
ncbi:MAG: lytic murein transglycosylase B [Gammaproteobacteria bacterium]|nr:lytic murein transglycosylase B [Gammaproteobacteria bacterium]MDH5594901.1 lytic murein transglycosylase B [Gammaproteobacteria bacterium]